MSRVVCNIKLENFQGPLDLLLHLIKSKNLDILNLDVLSLINQYISYVHSQIDMDINIASEYLITASYLLEIKSRLLIPKEKIIIEEEEDDFHADRFKSHLLEYKKIKDISEQFRIRKTTTDKLISKNYSNINVSTPMRKYNLDFDINLLANSFQAIVENLKKNHLNKINIKNDILLPEKVELIIVKKLMDILDRKILFIELVKSIGTSLETLIAVFLSILNLAQARKIFLSQKNKDIFIELIN